MSAVSRTSQVCTPLEKARRKPSHYNALDENYCGRDSASRTRGERT